MLQSIPEVWHWVTLYHRIAIDWVTFLRLISLVKGLYGCTELRNKFEVQIKPTRPDITWDLSMRGKC